MTRRQGILRWLGLLLAGVSIAVLSPILTDGTAAAARKQSLGRLVTTVVDRTGKPVDAIVVIQGAQSRAGRTDVRGRYAVNVPPGRYIVSAIYAGLTTRSRGVSVLPGRTGQTTIVLAVTNRPAPSSAGNQKSPTPSSPGVSSPRASSRVGQPSDTSGASGKLQSGSAQVPQTLGSAASTGSTSSAAADSGRGGAGANPRSQGSRPVKIKGLKAEPSVTQPGATSTISAELSNPDNLALTYFWQASGGSVSGTGAQATWVAPQSPGQFTISLTVKDATGRTSSGTVNVYAQATTAPAKIVGQVTDSFGVALAGASVIGAGPQSWSVITDSDGNYRSPDLPGGSYNVTASLNGYTLLTRTANVASGSTVVVNLALAKTVTVGQIGGRITNAATGAGIETATVSGSGPQSWNVTTDASGYYTSPELPTGIYSVAASKSGYSSVSKSVSVGTGALATTDFALSQTSQTGNRDPALWPFDKLSPWNRPLGANAVYESIQSALTGGGFTSGGLNYSKWTVPFWMASPNDPIRKIYPKRWNGELRPSGFFVEYRIPNAATPSPDSDGNMIVISPGHLTEVELYRATKRPDGGWDAQNGREVDLKSDGRFGTVTNGTALGGGVIRAGELSNGIKHALAFTANKKMWNRYAPGGKPSVWPARMADHYALDPEPGGYGSSGNLYMGSWVAIPPTVNITALGLETAEGHVLARALQDYGAIGTISGGSGSRIAFRYDYAAHVSGIAPAADMEAFKRDLNRLALRLHVVVNSHNNGKAPTLGPTEGIGGGTPRTSFAPDFSSSQGQPIKMVTAAAGILLLRGRARRTRR